MLYDNPLEILEAMGFDGAFGAREWFGHLHVDDVEAIAQALFHMQRREHVSWRARGGEEVEEEASFLFEQELMDAAHDLDICYRRALVSSESHVISPSFYSFGVDQRYILEKIVQFFTQHVLHDLEDGAYLEHDVLKGERHLRLRLAEPSYKYVTLVRLPTRYVYSGMHEIRLELHRLLQEAICVYALSSLYASTGKRSVRALHWDGSHFVDMLWGITGDEYQQISMR